MTFHYLTQKAKTLTSPIAQKGTFAIKKIRKGETIAIFGGYVISLKKWENMPRMVREICLQINDNFFIGPKKINECGEGDFINHSCDPNAGIKGQIYLVAMRDIKQGEEITFDYVMTISESTKINFKCGCKSKNCRKIFTSSDWRKTDLQEKYQGYFSYYQQQKIDLNNTKLKNKK